VHIFFFWLFNPFFLGHSLTICAVMGEGDPSLALQDDKYFFLADGGREEICPGKSPLFLHQSSSPPCHPEWSRSPERSEVAAQ